MAKSNAQGVKTVSGGKSPTRQVMNSDVINVPFTPLDSPQKPIDFNIFQPAPESDVSIQPNTFLDNKQFDTFDGIGTFVDVNAGTAAAQELSDTIKAGESNFKKQQLAFAGARLFLGVMNAQSQYNAISSQAKSNIFLAHQSAADAISRGASEKFTRVREGQVSGEQAVLALAAQGQDVTGAGVQRVQGSQEAVGVYNGMIEEINSIREALGFQQEAILQQGRADQAETQRNYSVLGQFLQFGASAYAAG